MRYSQLTCLIAIAACGCSEPNRTTADRDNNTSVNQREIDGVVKTPDGVVKTPLDNPVGDQRDMDLTAEIRKRLADSNLSTTIQNVTITSVNGQVTLRGVANSEDEKKKIEELVRSISGVENVVSHLEVDKT